MKIGVVIATFNGEKYICEQIESIALQTLRPDEVVISDGGSFDNTVEKCSAALEHFGFPLTKILTAKEQLGVTQNFQKAILACESDYIFLSDQDDVWDCKKIQKVVDLMIKYDADMAFTNASIVNETLEPLNRSLWDTIGYEQNERIRIIEKMDYSFIHTLLKHNVGTGMCMCLKKSLIPVIMPFYEFALHDSWITMLSAFSARIIAINDQLVKYRQHSHNVVGTSRNVRGMIKKSATYFSRIEYRRDMIILAANRIEELQNNKIAMDLINDYILFLNDRVNYIKKRLHNSWILRNYLRYKKFENEPIEIMLKDFFTRTTGRY